MATVNNVLRIGTWNLREAVPVNQDSGLADKAQREIIELLIRYKLDIVGLQEVDFHASRSQTLGTVSKRTPLKHSAHSILSESAFHPGSQAGIAIVSRFPMKDVTRQRFKNPQLDGDLEGSQIRTFDKGYISATVVLAHKVISAVSLHVFPFHLFGRDADDPAFANIWSDLSGGLAELTSAPLVVCGDFNTEKRDLISQTSEVPLSRAITHQPTYRNQSVDDMLFTSQFKLNSVGAIDNFSDHRLCYAELTWSDKDESYD